MLCWDLKGRPLGPSSPPLAVAGLAGRKENGPTLPLYHVYYIKPMYPSGGHDHRSLLVPGGLAHRKKLERVPNKTVHRAPEAHENPLSLGEVYSP